MSKPAEDPLVAQAFDAKKHEDLARAIDKLTPDEAAFFVHKLENAIKKRKIQLIGYLAAMVVWLIAMVLALVYFGAHDTSGAWVFAVPFAAVGAILYGFGRWANSLSKTPAAPAAPGASAAPKG